jgi:hypothetical protein
MTRERQIDFLALNEYLCNYSIKATVHDKAYQSELKALHKCYFSLLTWNSEIVHGERKIIKESADIQEAFEARLCEAFSDLGSSIFNWVHGGYKASRIMARSAIENFVRCVAVLEDKSVLEEKNVYAVFDRAAFSKIFNESASSTELYKRLHSDYKVLCSDVHTASEDNMENITFLAEFPRFNAERSRKSAEIICRIFKTVISLLCLIFPNFFHQMHHKNKENILISIPRSLKPKVLGVSD